MNYVNHSKVKTYKQSSEIHFFLDFRHKCFYELFSVYIQMSSILSAKCYQGNKERLQKKLGKDIKIFLKNRKKKEGQYGHECYKNLCEYE